MHEIIDGERDRLNEQVLAIVDRHPALHSISRTGGGNVGDRVSFEAWFRAGQFSADEWKEIEAELRRVRLAPGVRRGRICYSVMQS